MKVTFGMNELDAFLDGFEPGYFTTFYGSRFGYYLSKLLCVRAQLPQEHNGLDSKVVFIDGGNSFDPYVVSAIAQQHGLDPQGVLEKIFISRAFTAYQLTSLVFEKLNEALEKSESKVVVISDIISLFLDRDVPKTESKDIFNRLATYLARLALDKQLLILATHYPRWESKRSIFLEAMLLGRSDIVIRLAERYGAVKLGIVKHPYLEPKEFLFHFNGNRLTLKDFIEV